MNRRLFLLFALILAAGVVRLSVYGLEQFRLARLRTEALTPLASSGPPASHVPPQDPPPGRPFSDQPVSYAGPVPTRQALRASMKGTNVIVCVLDAARADHFSCYGYPRVTTPVIDRLAQEGVVFVQHFSQADQTLPSTLSLLTSEYPDTHGVSSNTVSATSFETVSATAFSLEGGLQRAGFHTYLLSDNPAASPSLGVGEDFMEKDYRSGGKAGEKGAGTRHLLGRITTLPARMKASSAPFFTYLHFLPPHSPYDAPDEIAALYRGQTPPRYWQTTPGFVAVENHVFPGIAPASWVDWVNAYDANLRWADACVGELVDTLLKAGLLDKTLLIVTADHGEALGEHGYTFHLDCPYDEALHIPLIIRFPGGRGPVGTVRALTQTVDLAPTIMDLCQASYPQAKVQGKSLLPLLAGETDRVHDFVFSRGGFKLSFAIVRDSHFALLLHQDGRRRALYDMDADPWQSRNVIAQHPDRAAVLERAFASYARSQKYPPLQFLDPSFVPPTRDLPDAKMSEETRRKLKSLGYVE